jgi:hypothetical protein
LDFFRISGWHRRRELRRVQLVRGLGFVHAVPSLMLGGLVRELGGLVRELGRLVRIEGRASWGRRTQARFGQDRVCRGWSTEVLGDDAR